MLPAESLMRVWCCATVSPLKSRRPVTKSDELDMHKLVCTSCFVCASP
jgi:hypothetical protein